MWILTAVVTLGRNEPAEIKTRIEMGFEPNSLSILAVPGKTLIPHALKRHSKKDIVVYTCTRISITYSFITEDYIFRVWGHRYTLQEVN